VTFTKRHEDRAREIDLACERYGAGGRIALIASALAATERELVKRMIDHPTEPFEQFSRYQDAVNAAAAVLDKYVGKDPCESWGGTYDWATECIEAFIRAFARESGIDLKEGETTDA
jgi:hypothetical protein